MGSNKPAQRGKLRIIGGAWRGRKLTFTAADGLRPTADRVRETLFNWLAGEVVGAHCLDLFAGSGALGLEALSRGAASCLFIEHSALASRTIEAHLATLGSAAGSCLSADALRVLANGRGEHAAADIVFLDPPFAGALLLPAAQLLEAQGWLAAGAYIYVESSRREAMPMLADNWQLQREKNAGEVRFQLFVRNG